MQIPSALTKYIVTDLAVSPDEIRLALLLESPHTAEVAHKHPLAGRAGQAVSAFFVGHIDDFRDWDRKTPFGCQLIQRKYAPIGVVNCANLPMDPSAYASTDYQRHADLIDALNLIRRNPNPIKRRDRLVEQVENRLLADLARRISSLPQECLIIPCGAVSRGLLGKCRMGGRRVYPRAVPHPSRNNWRRKSLFGGRTHFISAIQRQIAADA